MKVVVCENASDFLPSKHSESDVRVKGSTTHCRIHFMADSEAAKKFTEHGYEFTYSRSVANGIEKGFQLKGHYEFVVSLLRVILGNDTEIDFSLIDRD